MTSPIARADVKREQQGIGERLKVARVRAGVTQLEAATATGVTRPTVSNWEAGRNMPCLVQFKALLSLYGVAPSQILFDQNPFAITDTDARELTHAALSCSESLQRKVDTLLSVLPRT